MGKNELTNSGNNAPASYSKKDFDHTQIVNFTDIHRETCEPGKYTTEDIHSETYVSNKSSKKQK